MASTRAMRLAPWSASKIYVALRCPREFHYKYVEKMREVETMPEARVGKALHSALEKALEGTIPELAVADARAELTEENELERFDRMSGNVGPFVDRIAEFRRRRHVSRQMIEFTLAVRADFTPTPFYAANAFFRGVFDAAFLYERTLALIDHKTGFRFGSHRIIEQLQGYAVLSAASFKNIRSFRLGIHWVADGEVDWSPVLPAADINKRLVPNLASNIEAAALAVDDGPRPDPGVWCGVCSYRSVCAAAYEARYEPVDDYDIDADLHD